MQPHRFIGDRNAFFIARFLLFRFQIILCVLIIRFFEKKWSFCDAFDDFFRENVKKTTLFLIPDKKMGI